MKFYILSSIISCFNALMKLSSSVRIPLLVLDLDVSPHSEQISKRQSQIDRLYVSLKDLVEERKSRLEQQYWLYQLNREVDELEQWIAQREVVASSPELGQDFEHVTVSQRQMLLQAQMKAYFLHPLPFIRRSCRRSSQSLHQKQEVWGRNESQPSTRWWTSS